MRLASETGLLPCRKEEEEGTPRGFMSSELEDEDEDKEEESSLLMLFTLLLLLVMLLQKEDKRVNLCEERRGRR